MKAYEAVEEIARGRGAGNVSRDLGFARTYLPKIKRDRREVGASLLARIAEICGWSLVLVPKGTILPGESIKIEPRETAPKDKDLPEGTIRIEPKE